MGEWVIGIWMGLSISTISSTASHEIPTEIINSGANPIRGVIGAEGGLGHDVGGPSRPWAGKHFVKEETHSLKGNVKLLQNKWELNVCNGMEEAGWMGIGNVDCRNTTSVEM